MFPVGKVADIWFKLFAVFATNLKPVTILNSWNCVLVYRPAVISCPYALNVIVY